MNARLETGKFNCCAPHIAQPCEGLVSQRSYIVRSIIRCNDIAGSHVHGLFNLEKHYAKRAYFDVEPMIRLRQALVPEDSRFF